MIKVIPDVKIGGKKIFPYSIDYSDGGSSGPSSLSLVFVNKDGREPWPELDTKSVSKVTIGSFFEFEGHVVTASKSQNVEGETLTIKYKDTSKILDHIFVGLKGIHGPGFETESITGSVYRDSIILGEQVDPCKDMPIEFDDPCAPTNSSTAAENNYSKAIDCLDQRKIKILDVVYSFNQLLNQLGSQKIPVYNRPVENANYFGRYTGSLREVLNSWCQEYGITFYWKNGIHFVDLKFGIEINDTISESTCTIFDSSETRSIENNYAQATINYFGLDGQIREYSSSLPPGVRLTLFPINLADIFQNQSNGALNPFIKKYYGSLQTLQQVCILSKYSTKLRDIFIQKYLYNIQDEYYSGDNGDVGGAKSMPLLGTTILNAYKYTIELETQNFFTTFLKSYTPLIDSVNGVKQFFAVRCFYDAEVHQKFLEMEKYLADEFMGRYWVRAFNQRGYAFSAPGGSVDFIESPSATNFDFSSKVPKSVLTVNNFLRGLFDLSTGNKTTNLFNGGLILLERTSPWQPEAFEGQMLEAVQALEKIHLNANNEVVPDVPSEEEGNTRPPQFSFKPIKDKQPVIKFFGNLIKSNFRLSSRGTGDHPLEVQNVKVPTVFGEFSSTYGLNSANCKAYEIQINNVKAFIYQPVQSHDNYGNQMPGLTVIAQKNGSSQYKVVIDKIQRVLANFPTDEAELKKTVGLRVNFRDATQYLNSILERISNTCGYDEEKVEQILKDFTSKFSYPAQVVQKNIFYSIGGVPESPITIEDGLANFSIKLDGAGGLLTELEYSNIPKTVPSDSVRTKDFERQAIYNFNKNMFSSDNKEILN